MLKYMVRNFTFIISCFNIYKLGSQRTLSVLWSDILNNQTRPLLVFCCSLTLPQKLCCCLDSDWGTVQHHSYSLQEWTWEKHYQVEKSIGIDGKGKTNETGGLFRVFLREKEGIMGWRGWWKHQDKSNKTGLWLIPQRSRSRPLKQSTQIHYLRISIASTHIKVFYIDLPFSIGDVYSLFEDWWKH